MACTACYQGSKHDFADPQGHFETVYGINTYVTGDQNATSKSVILYLPDFFSINLVNNKILADRYAKGTGCKVLFPDLIAGGGANVDSLVYLDYFTDKNASIWTKIWAIWGMLPILWLMRSEGPEGKFPTVLKYARAIKKDLGPGGKLGVAGFCWGGYGSTMLCLEKAVEGGSENLIDAQFNAHPSKLKLPDNIVDAIAKGKVPYSCAVAETDMMLDEKKGREVEAAVRERVGPPEGNNYEFVHYKGAVHGFAVRARPSVKEDMELYEKATKQAVDWYNKYLN